MQHLQITESERNLVKKHLYDFNNYDQEYYLLMTQWGRHGRFYDMTMSEYCSLLLKLGVQKVVLLKNLLEFIVEYEDVTVKNGWLGVEITKLHNYLLAAVGFHFMQCHRIGSMAFLRQVLLVYDDKFCQVHHKFGSDTMSNHWFYGCGSNDIVYFFKLPDPVHSLRSRLQVNNCGRDSHRERERSRSRDRAKGFGRHKAPPQSQIISRSGHSHREPYHGENECDNTEHFRDRYHKQPQSQRSGHSHREPYHGENECDNTEHIRDRYHKQPWSQSHREPYYGENECDNTELQNISEIVTISSLSDKDLDTAIESLIMGRTSMIIQNISEIVTISSLSHKGTEKFLDITIENVLVKTAKRMVASESVNISCLRCNQHHSSYKKPEFMVFSLFNFSSRGCASSSSVQCS